MRWYSLPTEVSLLTSICCALVRPNPAFEPTANGGPPRASKARFTQSALPARSVPPLAAAQRTR